MNSCPFFFLIYVEINLIEIIDRRKFDRSFKMSLSTPFVVIDYWIGKDTRRFVAYSGEINFVRLHKRYKPLIIRKVNKRETSLGLKISENQYNNTNVPPYWLSFFEDNDGGLKINVTPYIGNLKLKRIKEILNFFEWK